MSKRKFEGIWIPRELWLYKDLKPTLKILLKEIDSLDNSEKGCTARNEYFADFLQVSKPRISQMIKELENKGFIKSRIKYFKDSHQVQARFLKVIKMPGLDRNLPKKEWIPERKTDSEIPPINKLNTPLENLDTLVSLLNHPIKKTKSPYLKNLSNINTLSISTLLKGVQFLANKLDETENELKKLKQKSDTCASPADIAPLISFEEFWNRYANKKGKKRAKTAFNRLSNKNKKLALEKIKDYDRYLSANTWLQKMLPITWINGERWNDDFTIKISEAEKIVHVRPNQRHLVKPKSNGVYIPPSRQRKRGSVQTAQEVVKSLTSSYGR